MSSRQPLTSLGQIAPTGSNLERRTSAPPTSSGQHLLQPNRAPSTRAHQTILVEANSIDRNYLSQVPTNPLRFLLARPLKDVRSVELVSGTVPARPFTLTKANNQFTFQQNVGGTLTNTIITIPPAYYTSTTLAAALEAALPTSLDTYTVTATTDGFCEITSTGAVTQFALLFLTGTPQDTLDRWDGFLVQRNTPDYALGFDINDYYSQGNKIRSPYTMSTAILRLYLYIDFENTQSLSAIERGSGRRPPFAIIYLDTETNGYKFLNKETITCASYSLPQPLSRLQAIQIDFRDEFYRSVDFGGHDFALLFQFTVLE